MIQKYTRSLQHIDSEQKANRDSMIGKTQDVIIIVINYTCHYSGINTFILLAAVKVLRKLQM